MWRRLPRVTARLGVPPPRPFPRGAAGVAGVPPLVLALDLDETLLRPKIFGAPEHDRRTLNKVDFEVTLDVAGGVPCHIALRPGLFDFFDWIRARREEGVLEGPWLFAQGVDIYVRAVLPRLDPTGDVFGDRILSSASCTKAKTPGYVMKDLTHVPGSIIGGQPVLPRVILVDNNAISAILHPENVMMVRDWRADTEEDSELARVCSTLDALIDAERKAPNGGNYAARLSSTTPRHDAFKRNVPMLRSLVDSNLRDGENVQARLAKAWQKATKMKQDLLQLPHGAC